jgi:electron transfer flavoprotein-quinone oxidoreductase
LDISEVTLLSDEKFQVIVVGAGVAGCAAAYRLAKAGREVLLVDRAKTAGAKNVTGGRLYTYALEELMPGEWADAPLEREITREIVMMMANGNGVALDSRLTGVDRLSLIRCCGPSWMRGWRAKAEEAGAIGGDRQHGRRADGPRWQGLRA